MAISQLYKYEMRLLRLARNDKNVFRNSKIFTIDAKVHIHKFDRSFFVCDT